MINIDGHEIGEGRPVYIISEMSGNHNQSFEHAVKIIHAMKESGADAIKVQTYTADTLTIKCDRDEFKIGKGTIWEGQTLYELYEGASMPWEWQPKLKTIAEDLDMDFFSTPLDETAVDFLEEMNVPAYKVGSFELIDLALIKKIAATGKPMIVSTGMGSKQEIAEAVDCIRAQGNNQIILLKCTSAYPALPQEADLNTMLDMRDQFGCDVGLSDHTIGNEVVLGAMSLGACIIEKHFCISREEKGPDSAFSLEPHEFKDMVSAVQEAEKHPESIEVDSRVLGTVNYDLTEKEKSTVVFRRSLFAVEDIAAGEIFSAKNVRSIRPGYGLPPKEIDVILGKKAAENIEKGTPLRWELAQ